MYLSNCPDTMNDMRLSKTATINLSWRVWFRDGVRLLGLEASRTWALLKTCRCRARSRRHLAALDARLLQDIGVSRTAALNEARKPFWQD